MKSVVIMCFIFMGFSVFTAEPSVNLPNQGVLGKSRDYFDPSVDYANQTARVSDIDDSKTLYKLKFENNNIKFLKKGDLVKFRVLRNKTELCQGQVRSAEDYFVTIEVATLEPCWNSLDYFRRGTILSVSMPVIEQRIFEATHFKKLLVTKKSDFYTQLKELNNFLYNYDQERVKLIVEYDERMARLMEEKKKAVRALEAKRKESYGLRHELSKKLDEAERDLRFYQIEREEPLVDRWHLSHDLGHPVGTTPQNIIK